MDSEPAEAGDYSGLPGERITMNQLVAANMRRWRRAAGLTQDELGERIGWSGANVSAAERSAEPGRDKRRFDADVLLALAEALHVPVTALFLPPDDDGIGRRYVIHGGPGRWLAMGELFSLVVSDPADDDSPVATAYREKYLDGVRRYLDQARGEVLAGYLAAATTAQQRAAAVDRIRWQREAMAALVADLDQIADAITGEGQDQ